MDDIDITDSTFSLNNNFEESLSTQQDGNSSSMYMYIAIAVGILFLCYIFYISYNKGKRVTFQDKLEQCYGDVCYPDE